MSAPDRGKPLPGTAHDGASGKRHGSGLLTAARAAPVAGGAVGTGVSPRPSAGTVRARLARRLVRLVATLGRV
ncbi:hypothetical protein LK07_12600 [Streptomyces pluripotens]|uniref:Uncharacterized protein n=1 Tax=Streptomyces pluripotens TaxID=1355015 RepID=A0A221NY37_9ACTN|nr:MULTISPECIES: hypothetical protein [Streptomyces]ASN24736.1 hypothetical protein LK07_12600 [Streptomyces pluripotens]KIE25397.1 hypothetical protein LK08_19555 [Streptomyces sp. MUSC 125]MCH0561217.1 hypothetical protein [Streptomyces sp. MUM 16J]